MNCAICKKEITDAAYCEVSCTIVQQNKESKEPIIFTGPDQRSYYNTKIMCHDNCWISLIGQNTSLNLKGGLGLIPVSQ